MVRLFLKMLGKHFGFSFGGGCIVPDCYFGRGLKF